MFLYEKTKKKKKISVSCVRHVACFFHFYATRTAALHGHCRQIWKHFSFKASFYFTLCRKKQIFTVITHQTCIPYTSLTPLPHQTRELQLRTRLRFMISQVRPLIKGQAAATAGPHPDLGILPALFPSFCSASCRFSSDLNCISCPDSE